MLVIFSSKVFGFLREMILSYYYGTSVITDVYIVSTTIPVVIFAFVGVAISTSFIPIYTEIQIKDGEIAAQYFMSNLIAILLVACTIICGLVLAFAESIIGIIAIGFSHDAIVLSALFLRITIFLLYCSSIITIGSSYLQIKGNQIIPALMGIVYNVLFMGFVVISNYKDVIFIANW